MIALVLRHRLLFAPVQLSTVTRHFAGLEHIVRLSEIAKEFLPEERDKLLRLPPSDAARRFVQLFSARWFPIQPPNDYGYPPLRQVTEKIRIAWGGLNRYEYNQGHIEPGHLVAAALCVSPFRQEGEGQWCHPGQTTMGSARAPVIDRLLQKAPEAARLLPGDGYPIEHMMQVLEHDTTHPGLREWCLWLFSRTGNVWLDKNERDVDAGWTRENVETLARDWPECGEIRKRMDAFNSWLGHDFPARATEVIKHIRSLMAKRPKTLAEIPGKQ